MPALTQDTIRFRNSHARAVENRARMAASVTCHQGSLVAVNTATGFAGPATTSTTIRVLGVATSRAVNGAVAGATSVPYESGDWEFANLVGDPLTTADIGNACFVVDDDTVARTNGTSTRSAAGIFLGFSPVNPTRVMVRVGLGMGST